MLRILFWCFKYRARVQKIEFTSSLSDSKLVIFPPACATLLNLISIALNHHQMPRVIKQQGFCYMVWSKWWIIKIKEVNEIWFNLPTKIFFTLFEICRLVKELLMCLSDFNWRDFERIRTFFGSSFIFNSVPRHDHEMLFKSEN